MERFIFMCVWTLVVWMLSGYLMWRWCKKQPKEAYPPTCDRLIIKPCLTFYNVGNDHFTCAMRAGHTGPHRLMSGEAFSTAKRKARELNKAVNLRVDEITAQAFPE